MYKSVPIKYAVFYDNDNPIFGEETTHIYLEDEAAGAYLILEQFPDEGIQKIKLDLDELILLTELAQKMVDEYNEITKGPENERGIN